MLNQNGTLRIAHKRIVADGVAEFTLRAVEGTRLPDWAPGAHIDVILPAHTGSPGSIRQYSLCGDRWDPHEYRIMVRREAAGRGGSRALYDEVQEGDVVGFGGPRNNFRLPPAKEYLFIAGGIGITPILPMIDQARRLSIPWRLLYLGRELSQIPSLDHLLTKEEGATAVTVHTSRLAGRVRLDEWRPTDPEVRVFSCGPSALLDAVEAWGAVPGGLPPRVERFSAQELVGAAPTEFEIVAERSGATTVVSQSESVVEALRRVGVSVLTSCAQGVCGTCETDVLSGAPEHRDSVLNDAERAEGLCMFPCVSRSYDARLVLDI